MKEKHCNDISSGAKVEFECDECDRIFTTKSGRSRHKTVTHKKETEKKEELMKRTRSVEEKPNPANKCEECNYICRSKWALKAHISHTHKEPTSPNEKKPKISSESKIARMFSSEVVDYIISEVVQNKHKEEEPLNKNKTTIEPTVEFLTNTAVTLAEMLDNIADHIEDEDEEDDTEELENRLDILRGDIPRNKKVVDDNVNNTLVTLPLKDVEEMRLKLRNLEDINEGLMIKLKKVDEMEKKFENLEKTNQELAHKLKESEEMNKKKASKKSKEQPREEFIVIEMETNDDDEDIVKLVQNKENGFARSNPQGEPMKKKDIHVYDCPACDKKFNRREHMQSHQKTHEVKCTFCDKMFKNDRKLKDHTRMNHDEMICHMQCEGGVCSMRESENSQTGNPYRCNFCERTFPSKNALSTHRTDVHRTFKPCRDIANCQFQSGCFYSHIPITLGKVRCYQCGEEFDSKNTMMIHRKVHGGVKECTKLLNNQCDRGENCWWSHIMNQQVFQKVQENLPPPILRTKQTPWMLNQQEQMMPQSPQNEILVSMLKTLELELKKIKEVLNIV